MPVVEYHDYHMIVNVTGKRIDGVTLNTIVIVMVVITVVANIDVNMNGSVTVTVNGIEGVITMPDIANIGTGGMYEIAIAIAAVDREVMRDGGVEAVTGLKVVVVIDPVIKVMMFG